MFLKPILGCLLNGDPLLLSDDEGAHERDLMANPIFLEIPLPRENQM